LAIEVVQRSLADRRVRASLVRLLRENTLASFATVDARGTAHIHTAYFAWSDDWQLFFYSYPDSLHGRNLARRPSMAVTVFDSHQRWGHPDRGVQLFGTGRKALGRWAEVAAEVYSKRFPGYAAWRARAEGEEGSFRLRPYRFRPRSAKVFDERALGGGRFIVVKIPGVLRR
jgi:uncharacterized protein YhbP (UPF0306 family)